MESSFLQEADKSSLQNANLGLLQASVKASKKDNLRGSQKDFEKQINGQLNDLNQSKRNLGLSLIGSSTQRIPDLGS
jgi:hypothetical protein